jgi:hypothetical protein
MDISYLRFKFFVKNYFKSKTMEEIKKELTDVGVIFYELE